MQAIVTLTTDFGTRDPYAAAVKGVLLSRCAGLTIVDLTHEIAPRDVVEGSLFLSQAAPWFPPGTVHLAVIDPGVGTGRGPLAVRAGGHLFVLPDNGLVELVLRRFALDRGRSGAPRRANGRPGRGELDGLVQEARVIDPRRVGGGDLPVSATFHGRDLFAPAAGALACGLALCEIGPEAGALARLGFPPPLQQAGEILGEVVHVDRFGNLISNIDSPSLGGCPCVGVEICGRALGAPLRTYGETGVGQVLTLWNSAGLLEVAVRDGSAAAVLGAGRGTRVKARRS